MFSLSIYQPTLLEGGQLRVSVRTEGSYRNVIDYILQNRIFLVLHSAKIKSILWNEKV
jgi:hypothetical protein